MSQSIHTMQAIQPLQPQSIDNSTQPVHSFPLPKQPGFVSRVGQLVGSASARVCADIAHRHPGAVIVITADMQQALRLQAEIPQFSPYPVELLNNWETLPYDMLSPYQEAISTRLASLYQLPMCSKGIWLLAINTLLQRVCPHTFLQKHALIVKNKQHLSRDQLQEQLQLTGYRAVEQVMVHGEFAIRGALLDLFPMGSSQPYRLDFFDDEIDSLRLFDIDSQRTVEEVDSINLLPAHEFPTDQAAIELFRSQWRERFDTRRDTEHLYQQVSKGVLPAGIEYWQPLFFSEPLVALSSYFPSASLLVTLGSLQESAARFWQDITQRYESRRHDLMRPLLPPDNLWLPVDQLFQQLKAWPRIELEQQSPSGKGSYTLGYQPLPKLTIQAQAAHLNHSTSLELLRRFIEQFTGTIVFSVESEGRQQALLDLLARIKLRPQLIDNLQLVEQQLQTAETNKTRCYLTIGNSEYGFIDHNLALICESDLMGERVSQKRRDNRRIINADTLIRNLAELNPGQPVVHLDHGVGRYGGLTTLSTGGVTAEYLVLIYADDDKLYVPVTSLHLISRYSGNAEERAPLYKLGGEAWAKARQKAVEKIRDVAAELLDLYAQRANIEGFAFIQDDEQYQLFCQAFPFETTPDQENAINAVLEDMCQPIAMDRVICGDVGFGKTEVAMRAAFLAILNTKQVVVLVPTTLLAQQHFDNFSDRFANWPVRIEMLSRFRTAKEQQQIIEDSGQGKVDILIGTHKLLQADMKWHDLGLMVIDEEHRFGVRQKEKLKSLRSQVDILTLTATPIPRTLNMAMSGIRDLSIIATPPARRLSIKTFIREYDVLLVREAILREVLRGGQVYYLYNDVAGIGQVAEKLAELVPEARITVGHGQMRERDLEHVMMDFHHLRFNVLVCTTIIETGIDISSANTIIIERADRFGLAQLYQLRGRVGRSYHQAYAYLLTPPPQTMGVDAHKRLEALASLEELGAGFALATHDLEIRGAGELLGSDQSGQMETIGFSLYMELLEEAVQALKEGREPSLEQLTANQSEIELRIPALLPETLIPDVGIRLSFYKRIANCKQENELDELKVELIDRFGKLPPPVDNLLKLSTLRQQAKQMGITRIEYAERGGFIEFGQYNQIKPDYLIMLLQSEPQHFQLDGPTRLKLLKKELGAQQRLEYITLLLKQFTEHLLIE